MCCVEQLCEPGLFCCAGSVPSRPEIREHAAGRPPRTAIENLRFRILQGQPFEALPSGFDREIDMVLAMIQNLCIYFHFTWVICWLDRSVAASYEFPSTDALINHPFADGIWSSLIAFHSMDDSNLEQLKHPFSS